MSRFAYDSPLEYSLTSRRLFMKGARNLDFEKLREICGDYQQLNYAKGEIYTNSYPGSAI